ncbi:PREDICTED: uncharacterized protein At3g28850 [Nelumbo nucifera]|uniref:Uncharacterized protein At3g28850 n=1 Tax=Nelumbo nucifera TaxID=4432 RepID=A0A1U8AJI2_NELNU|nr:PREDICTED: uncharacterized protein At3g28850 [Nelumbo nucifera]XP_010267403.1 PREDICTED: uncharacterized protein At3g28850 [Nelumbo nucifera]XP_010267404.1 PREDICTED: uncharacterized protein At3g28850 [Nelumbo nucifera]XP_010267405.1 PREDICTED: uncharacterized protein At3g28850 [Nelumbo nucifera]XP_010267406.1 PREDICTED: uncharacterized protein At3g28850 [Nelumbo nucifera]
MGCVSSTLLDHDDEFSHLAGSGLGHHIVSLTSTTYGLLTLDPPPHADHHLLPPTPPRFTLGSLFPSPLPELRSLRSEPEVINSWELMAGLDTDSFRFSPTPPTKPSPPSPLHTISEIDSRLSRPPKLSTVKDYTNADANNKENSNPNRSVTFGILSGHAVNVLKPVNNNAGTPPSVKNLLDGFEKRCPPNGESKVVIYTTTLRGVRKTFEACNAVRAALEGFGVLITERDVSMDRGFRDELRELLKGKESGAIVPPRVFVNGRYIGGAEEVLRLHEEGCLAQLLEGLPKATVGAVCEGCGGVRFLPCFQCSGSCKLVMVVEEQSQHQPPGSEVVVRCPDCNENGLVLCPICS